MQKSVRRIAALASLALLVLAQAADADTILGTTTQPSGSSEGPCLGSSAVLGQLSGDQSTTFTVPYTVPGGGGAITQWQTLTVGDTPGVPLTLVVLRRQGSPDANYTIVGADSETIPNGGGVASYTLAHPITVQPGDTLGLYAASGGANCSFSGGMTAYFDSIVLLSDSSPPPSGGQTLTFVDATPFGTMLNLAATLSQAEDAGVTAGASASGVTAGHATLLSSTVTNAGPSTAPITFSDHVPAGLAIDSVAAGNGTCSISGQTVSCTISGLAPGQGAPVNIVVTPAAPGAYTNGVSVAVSSPFADPSAANNGASATVLVSPPAPNPQCVVPKLKNAPSSVAKTVLKDLGCTVKTKHKHSSLHKGAVIGTSPGAGTYPYQTAVTLKVSSGKKH